MIFCSPPGMLSLREGLSLHLAEVQQKLSDGLRVAAVLSPPSREFPRPKESSRFQSLLFKDLQRIHRVVFSLSEALV